jgi:hypothetical protein
MHNLRHVMVVTQGQQLSDWIAQARQVVQSYHHIHFMIVINSANQAELPDPQHDRLELLAYPSNRIIEPAILMFQLAGKRSLDRLWYFTTPGQINAEVLNDNGDTYAVLGQPEHPVGLMLNRGQLVSQPAQIPTCLNQMRRALQP